MTDNTPADELREKLADIEHQRWADWQKYVHGVSKVEADGVKIPMGYADHWDRQINTPYAELSEREKQSDREQVDRYWHLIEEYVKHRELALLERPEKTIKSMYVSPRGLESHEGKYHSRAGRNTGLAQALSAIQKEKEQINGE